MSVPKIIERPEQWDGSFVRLLVLLDNGIRTRGSEKMICLDGAEEPDRWNAQSIFQATPRNFFGI